MASMAALRINSSLAVSLMFGLLLIILLAFALFFQLDMYWGLIIGIIITATIMLMQWAISPWIVEKATRVKYLKPGENVFLERMVSELCMEADVKLPRLGIVHTKTPNAFVWGRSKNDMRLAVHTGLLEQLNKDEIRAVLGHEIGHIKHKDAIVMTFISVIPLIAYMGAHMLWFGGGRSRDSGGIVAFGLLCLVIYLISQLIVLRISRIREYYSDAYSAEITKNPHALASALVKITYGLSLAPKNDKGQARSFYIADGISAAAEMKGISQRQSEYDLNGDGVLDERELELALEKESKRGRFSSIAEIYSTHPPTHKRVQALREIEREMRSGTFGE